MIPTKMWRSENIQNARSVFGSRVTIQNTSAKHDAISSAPSTTMHSSAAGITKTVNKIIRNRCGDPTYEFRARVEMMCAVPG